jgi:Ca-activated chloride channel family protein
MLPNNKNHRSVTVAALIRIAALTRSRDRKGAVVLVLSCLLVSAALWSQQAKPVIPPQSPPQATDTSTIFRADTRLVVCPTVVIDKTGHLVTTLPKEAFTVYENGVVQEIKIFKREDVPVSMGLIIDNSGSMRDKRAKVEAASLALSKDSNPDDEAFVVNFNDEAFLDLPHGKDFTSDIKELEEALTRIDSRGGTAMRDAIRMSIDHAKEKGHKDKKVLVVVTDGNDNSSVVSLENLVKAAQQAGILIYSVGLLGEEERREAQRAQRALKALAEATGGEAFFPKDVSEVDRIAHQVARDIRNQYTIEYTPSNTALDGSFRQIKITVKAAGNPTVRTRSGYYATPDQVAAPAKGTPR